MRALKFAAVVFVIMALSCSAAWSVDVSVQSFSALVSGADVVGSSSQSWSYTLRNTSAIIDYYASVLQIEATNAVVLSASSPVGLDLVLDQDTPNVVMWAFHDPDPGDLIWGLASGETLTGFRANFSAIPSHQGWTVIFETAEEAPADYGDVSFEPVGSTPEPGTIASMLTGLTSLAAVAYRRRRK